MPALAELRIRAQAALEAALAAPRFLLLKHSTRCGISAGAFAAYGAFLETHPDVVSGWIDVVSDRALSQEAARRTGVPHASPQALLLRDGRAVWDASHGAISVEGLERALAAP